MAFRRISLSFVALVAGSCAALADMPQGFVYLRSIDPSIVQDIRYAGANNFMGRPAPGYEAPECVLAKAAAVALAKVQAALKAAGRTLVVYDCYRPARAVAAFNDWAMAGGKAHDKRWHPAVARNQLVAHGYIAARSGHSSGGTVDLGLAESVAGGGPKLLDMGGEFDLFDPRSHTAARGLSERQRQNRDALVEAMRAGGFVNYSSEWWHYTLRGEPFKGKAFDFEIEPSTGQ